MTQIKEDFSNMYKMSIIKINGQRKSKHAK